MNALYTALGGMVAENQALISVGANLANANSPGYLRESGWMVGFPAGTVARTGPGPAAWVGTSVDSVAFTAAINQTPGGIEQTGVPTDLALLGQGFFVVRTPAGPAYTRNGQFQVDSQGRLATHAGYLLLSAAGTPIGINPALPFTVSAAGQVMQNGVPVAQLALRTIAAGALTNLGGGLYGAPATVPYAGTVTQGALDTSNVNLTQAAMQMMQAASGYQALTTLVNEESARLKNTAGLGVVV